MFQRRFAIVFFGPLAITRKSSYLKLTKGDKKEKVTKEKSTCLKLHWPVKVAPSNRATLRLGFVREEVQVLVEKRKVFRVHVLSKG